MPDVNMLPEGMLDALLLHEDLRAGMPNVGLVSNVHTLIEGMLEVWLRGVCLRGVCLLDVCLLDVCLLLEGSPDVSNVLEVILGRNVGNIDGSIGDVCILIKAMLDVCLQLEGTPDIFIVHEGVLDAFLLLEGLLAGMHNLWLVSNVHMLIEGMLKLCMLLESMLDVFLLLEGMPDVNKMLEGMLGKS